ncbi:MAG: septation regulator SpoVG [Elusimicrobiales bacterium]|jgi:stage V sporulation protein G|nr:septation regulator SpoVG [Elusimicrobiales bacterium]
MEITEVRIHLRPDDKLKAFATITFDQMFVVHNVKVVSGKNGLVVAMPSRRVKDGTFKDIAHPITNEFRSKLEKAVLDAYNKALTEQGTSTPQENNNK